METKQPTKITVEANVEAPLAKVWEYWITPSHIMKWNQASPDWHSPKSENDLRVGGTFTTRMEAKDGSFGFDFGGTYTEVEDKKRIAYELGDGRYVEIDFKSTGNSTLVTETFDAETQNSEELQKTGWQAIMDSFKSYVERN